MLLTLCAEAWAGPWADAPTGWLAVFGRAHPLLLHLPLGVLPAVALLEFGTLLLRRAPPRGSIAALAWFGALTAAAATASGLVLANEDYGGPVIGQHKVLGIALSATALLTAVLALLPKRLPFRLALAATLGLMLPTGHLGGTMTHGRDFLFAPLREAPPVAVVLPPDADTPPPPPPPGSDYERVIAPLLQQYCAKCHSEEKSKAELILTSPEAIRRGSEVGPVLVPGKPDESLLLTRCELPLDDDDRMPPADKPQPSADDVAALRAWIAAGAPF